MGMINDGTNLALQTTSIDGHVSWSDVRCLYLQLSEIFFTDWSDNYKAVILDFRELLESYKRVIRKLPEFDGSLEEG